MKNTKKTLILNPGRDHSVLACHPWIFSGAVDRVEGHPESGESVLVRDASGLALGWAAFSPASSIRARMWNLNPDETVDRDYFESRIRQAIERRLALVTSSETDALRLVHAESDGLPGLVVDRYADVLVVQILTTGAEFWREVLTDALVKLTGVQTMVERSDVDVRQLEGLAPRSGVLRGQAPGKIEIRENGLRFQVDVLNGQKTGFYLDQRRNRQQVGELAAEREVLNCFCYTGGFSIYALAQGARQIVSVDSSAEALEMGRQHVVLNSLPTEQAEWVEGDVFKVLRTLRDQGRSFDMVILDPPKFAPTAAQAERAARGYKDINLLGFKLLRPGGILATFSCSGGISAELFQKIVAGAALDAGADARIVQTLTQGPDHPVALAFPEGAYLKGLILQV
ncbi:MAG: class I SAM-dependent rRNA methyltransferase [Bellilinea sp.]